ncbi:MAG: SOS response-associated peptidase [Chlorobiaceae bacterium]|nr:SOS response-associated peptidase [Chlorobiaceae bacterium]
MCGRFGFFELSHFIEQLRQLSLPFEETPGFSYRQSWNITPQSPVVALFSDQGRYCLGTARWGLIPHWATQMPKIRPFNARSDSLAAKPYFRHMLNRHHCIIPASGFYEWKSVAEGEKEPWYIHRRDGEPMAFAGLWDQWQPPGPPSSALIVSCTIITTQSNREMKPVHNRMPAILEQDEWKGWLESGNPAAIDLLNADRDGALDLYPVSTRVNNPENNDTSCILRIDKFS